VIANRGSARHTLLDGQRHLDAQSLGHRVHLLHQRPDEVPRGRRGDDVHERSTCECAQRVEGRIAEKLEPDLVSNPRLNWGLQPGLGQHRRDREDAFALRAVGLAEGEAIALQVLDDARLDHVGCRVGDAADHFPVRDVARDDATRIH